MIKPLRRLFRFRKLTHQLTWLFIALVGTVLALFGAVAYTLAHESLEHELGRHLVSVARLKARALPGALVQSALPRGRAADAIREIAASLARESEIEAVQVLRLDGVTVIDTVDNASEGKRYWYLELDSTEWEQALKGESHATPLFQGRGGRNFKSAFAPILYRGKVVGVVRVEASADFLDEVRRFGMSLLLLGIFSLLLAIALAAFASRPLVDPMQDLISASRRVAGGDFSARVEVRRQDEIGQLSDTFNEMAERLGTFVREKERLATLGELAAGVVHEVRNPLAAIDGFASLIEKQPKGGDPKAWIKEIHNEVRIVNGFLTDFLEYAKPREPKLERLNPADVASAALPVVLPGDLGRRWKASWTKRQRLYVSADRDQLRQVFVNLLINAREASPKGGPIFLSSLREDDWVRISVKDKGKGISLTDREKLFTPFFTSKPMGTGLGLSIASKIVDGLGGYIDVESIEGKGSTFTVVLPRKA